MSYESVNSNVPKKGLFISVKKVAPVVLASLIIFTAGWLVGGGRLDIKGYKPNSANAKLPSTLDYSSVNTIYKSLKDNFDGKLSEDDLLDGLKSGLAKATGDPYTEFFNAKDAEDFYGQLEGTFEGIGAELGKDEAGNIVIISPLAGFPAEKAGLKPKDIIAKIDSRLTTDFTIDDAVKLIRGKAGTDVVLTVVRDGIPIEVKITRQSITVPSVKSEIKDGVGILTISRFSDDTSRLALEVANNFKARNVMGVVLDLRGNPGGLLESAVSVSSLWLDSGKVVLTERRDNIIIQAHKSRGAPVLPGIPTVVLIDGGSASASEITAGALRDNNVAKLVGTKTYGKGSVQQPINLKDGSLLKVTIARWYTPAGKNIDKAGITPDSEVKPGESDKYGGPDAQMDAALAELQK